MKTLYLYGYILVMSVALRFGAFAQCQLTNTAIELNSVTNSSGNCTVNVNLSFTIDKNNGNKFTYVHLWSPTSYPNINYASKAPDKNALGSVLATLAIDTDGTLSLLDNYSADPTHVIPLYAGLTLREELLSGTLYRVTIENISFLVPGACTSLPILKGDVWSTQAASANPNPHCWVQGFNLRINDPTITGKINCNDPMGPRTYDLAIATTSPTPFEVTYKLYLDDGVLSGGQTTFNTTNDELFFTSNAINMSSFEPIQEKAHSYPYDHLEDKRSIWVEVSGPSLPNKIVAELKNTCDVTLPVTLARFTGSLLDNAVSLSWTTTEESGSGYFDVERSTDSREFIRLGRVEAQNNSTATQQYNFVDSKPATGPNYYRLKMVDLDGSYERSRIIAINNDESSVAFELLGNPVGNREIKILLKNGDAANLNLYDLSGKSIRFSLSRSGNEYMLKPQNQLSSGLYILSLQGKNAGTLSKKVLVP